MSRRPAVGFAAAALVLAVVFAAGGNILGLARGSSVAGVPPVHWVDVANNAAFAVLPLPGLVIAAKRPRNHLWIILALAGVNICLANFTFEYAVLAELRSHPALPAAGLAIWLSAWIWATPGAFAAGLMLLGFPDGDLPGPRWRWPRRGLIAVQLLVGAIFAVDPTPTFGALHFANPVGIGAARPLVDFLFVAFVPLTLLSAAVGLAAVVVRYRSATGDKRGQIKWLLVPGVLFVASQILTGLATAFDPQQGALYTFATASNVIGVISFPTVVAVAIVRYGLFDIDLVINKTLVYGALAAVITAVYVAIVIGLGSVVGARSNVLLAIAATALIAIAFQPLRQRLQLLANRLVFGRRASPYEVVAEFAREIGALSGADVLQRMARALADGTGAERAEVWVGDRLAAGFGAASAGEPRAVEVSHLGERLGELRVFKRRGEALSERDERLLEDLAHQAGLVLRNVGLNQQLLQRLEELRASRQRLVRVQDEERRRLERDLHDGAQQHLVALKLQLALARESPTPALLAELEAQADEALRTMRELARGIYPPLLQDRGLADALSAQARRATLPVEVHADGLTRHPQEVEAAVYFCVLEALQNVQKHAAATSARVRITQSADVLTFEVADDGRGFDAGGTSGSGLTNLRDRVEALGGDLKVVSAPGQGTTVAGTVPVQRSSASSSSMRSNPSRTPDSMPELTIASRSASD